MSRMASPTGTACRATDSTAVPPRSSWLPDLLGGARAAWTSSHSWLNLRTQRGDATAPPGNGSRKRTIVVEEEPHVVDAVAGHGDPIDPEAEGETGEALRVVPARARRRRGAPSPRRPSRSSRCSYRWPHRGPVAHEAGERRTRRPAPRTGNTRAQPHARLAGRTGAGTSPAACPSGRPCPSSRPRPAPRPGGRRDSGSRRSARGGRRGPAR